ncbi:mitochondrial import receptor subunit TOM7 homolog [Chrysoperla carnea]|uniref:mitochondrial import receptor subunit TOM7 homolog n=1 Tax=Chrysoperla carnea TaxID=189513 RepID=UPI001D08D308|nr:mitochondrial import receptor subunit TOM7 homolog [Chrysoperla carnea]
MPATCLPEVDSCKQELSKRKVQSRVKGFCDFFKFLFHWGFIPFILFLGCKKGPDSGKLSFTFGNILWQ